jgi:phosphoribosylformylglycinamidine cyclo-ligase
MSLTYKKSGVDINEADKAVSNIKEIAKETYASAVLSGVGLFGGLFQINSQDYKEPVLVSSIDGVGTKIKIAIETDTYGTIGIDLVNHCVDDILAQGATPLFFMDYIGAGKLSADKVQRIIRGVADACIANNVSLIGGELAEMPGIFKIRDLDVVGSMVGIVEKSKIINGSKIKIGDTVYGLPSNGPHTNGYSFIRKLVEETPELDYGNYYSELGTLLSKALLQTHTSYLPTIKPILDKGIILGMANITGGGLQGNIKRILPKGIDINIDTNSWDKLPIFNLLKRYCDTSIKEFYKMFNMGIGFAVITREGEKFEAHCKKLNQKYYKIGEAVQGSGNVNLIGV